MNDIAKKHKSPHMPMDEKIDLISPADVDGTKVGQLTLRRPTVEDRLNADAATQGQSALQSEIVMIANLCEVDPGVIKKLFWADYKKCQDACNRMMGFL